jgi:hypothetical protein
VAKDVAIEIPAIALRELEVVIEGQTPLITHRFGERARSGIEDKQQRKAKSGREARDPDAEFKDALYVVDPLNDVYGFPAGGIKKALVDAGGRFAGQTMTVLRGAINIKADLLPISGSKPEMRADPVKLNGRTSTIAYRPAFFPWELMVPVLYNEDVLSRDQVVNLFQHAGFSVGIGDWRPEKKGTFGQFTIKEVRSR